MKRKCECQKKKREFSLHPMPRHERDSLIQTDYGLARIVQPTEVILHNDDYMLQEMHETKNKMKSMEKQIKKLKKKLKKCQLQIQCNNRQNSGIAREIDQLRKSRLDSLSQNQMTSRAETVTNSRKREVGRFTNAEEREGLQEQLEQRGNLQETKLKRISKENSKNQLLSDLRRSRKSKQSALEYSMEDEEVITRYGQLHQESPSKKSSLLLSKQLEDEYNGYDKQRLNHELDELIIEEKNTLDPVKKRTLRKEIGLISRRIATLENDKF